MEEAEQQVTKDQHYVPQFYLRKFVNPDGKLEILDCERRKIVISRTPKSVCNEEFFYALNGEKDEISQEIEKEFQRIETDIASRYDAIAKKFVDFQEITLNDKMVIATFMSMQYLRGPYMRKQIKRMDEDLVKQITMRRWGSEELAPSIEELEKTTGEKVTEKQRKELIDFATGGKYRVETNNSAHLKLLAEMQGFSNLLFHKEWTVYISKSSKKFITSDNPVVELFPDWTGKFFYGPTFLQRTHCFPMSPEIHIVATHPRSDIGNKIKRKTLFDNKEHNDKILDLNFNHPRHAIAYAYTNDKTLLQDIIDSANLFDKQTMRAILRNRK